MAAMPSRVFILRISFLAVFLSTSALALSAQDDYAGQWALKLGSRNFLVINFHEYQGKFTGTLSRPSHSSIGASFSNISPDVITEPIVSSSFKAGVLTFVVQNPLKKSDTDSYTFTTRDATLKPGQGLLQFVGVPVDPWVLTRVPASPQLTVATDWDPHQMYLPGESDQPSAEMQKIFEEDQKPRQSLALTKAEGANVYKQDVIRRAEVRHLLANGDLHTGKDFELAAFIFQHGDTPDDYLLAHTLAMIAVARGDPSALWIATATLDRYLNSIQKPQIYGTQFHFTKETPWTQEPYNRDLISDALRRDLGVPSLAAQQKQLEKYKTANQP